MPACASPMSKKSRNINPARRKGMPPQLQRKRPRKTPRPIVEQLPLIKVTDLPFPPNWHDKYILDNISLRYPWVRTLTITRATIQTERQTFRMKWARTGFRGLRPIFVCSCNRGATILYYHRSQLACKRCHDAIRASQSLNQYNRPRLQITRLQTFMQRPGLWKHTRHRLVSRLQTLKSKVTIRTPFKPRYLTDKALRPQGLYRTRAANYDSARIRSANLF
jgi:hypothetical protein